MYVPDQEIERIIFRSLDLEVESISRFNSEESHCICDVKTKSKNVVLRISSEDCFKSLEGSVYWLKTLRDEGIPVPEVLYVNNTLDNFKYHFIIIERIEGCDLGYIYPEMTADQKRELACKMISLQNKVSKISNSQYPGKKFLPTDSLKESTWYDYLTAIPRIADNIEDKDLFDVSLIHKYEEIALGYKDLLNSVKIHAFLDEATIRNVMVHDGLFTGIIDIDYINHGDSVKTIALTKMLLLKAGYDLHYIDFWCYEQGLTEEQYVLLDIYMLRYCLKFMSKVGEVDKENSRIQHMAEIDRLKILFNQLYVKLKKGI
tara:strand:+ start:6174 stop:7124 length:951 start_codon:yes stop_codon:yes gene_type:complete